MVGIALMAAPRDPQLSALRVAAPARWRARVRKALVAAGTIPGAAKALGINERTLYRWIADDPDLARGIELPLPRASVRKAVR